MIVVLGSTNTDMTVYGKRIPVPGETVSGGSFRMAPGGKGANQAVAVARLSRRKGACCFIAKVGDDLFGRETAVRMKKEGIDARLVVDSVTPSGTALILVDAKGRNCISVALGANGTLRPEDVRKYEKDIRAADALLLQLETPLETVLWAAKTAHEAGVTVLLNPAPARKLPRALCACVDWMTPNETEAERLTGIRVANLAGARKAEAALRKLGVGHVVITMGSRGCYAGGKIHPCEPAKAVDTVAAGDTFNGAFAVALTEGRPLDDAIRFAQKASAIAVSRPGAQDSIPRRREIQ